jgi:hypothetical protein
MERRLLTDASGRISRTDRITNPSNNQSKHLIILMEATSGIEPEYTVLQTVA